MNEFEAELNSYLVDATGEKRTVRTEAYEKRLGKIQGVVYEYIGM